MTDRDSFLAAVLDRPEDDTLRLVFADWLRDRDDPADQLRGRFLWAGVVAGRYRHHTVIEDPEYYEALREIAAVARSGAPAGWLAALGLGDAGGTWAWDSSADEVIVRLIPAGVPLAGDVAAVFLRGMLTGLRVPLGVWGDAGPSVAAACPLSRVEVTDVPGLTFTLGRAEGDRAAGWELRAELRVRGVHRWVPVAGEANGPGDFRPEYLPPERWSVADTAPTRPKLVEGLGERIARLVARLHDHAADRWPQPPERGRPGG